MRLRVKSLRSGSEQQFLFDDPPGFDQLKEDRFGITMPLVGFVPDGDEANGIQQDRFHG